MTQLNAKCQFVKDTLADQGRGKASRLQLIVAGGNSRMAKAGTHGKGLESAMYQLLHSFGVMADEHKNAHGSPIGDDNFLGPYWESIGHNLLGLLNGDIGGLDCGDMDAFIRQCLTEEGFDGDSA